MMVHAVHDHLIRRALIVTLAVSIALALGGFGTWAAGHSVSQKECNAYKSCVLAALVKLG